jgi:hypothetical protein
VSPGFVATEPELVRFHNRSILILVQKIQSRLKGFQCMSELQPQQELQLSLRLHWSRSRPADMAYQQVSALQTSMNLEFIGSRLPVEREQNPNS